MHEARQGDLVFPTTEPITAHDSPGMVILVAGFARATIVTHEVGNTM